eukprot:scaffold8005_cov118-Isochrysis_galbana.AAC.25
MFRACEKVSLVATHSLASSNSFLKPNSHRLSKQSTSVAPRLDLVSPKGVSAVGAPRPAEDAPHMLQPHPG